MSFSPALVYDFIFLAVFSFAAVKSWQKGFLAGLTELIGAVLGVGIASWGSRTLAPEVYLSFFSDSVSTRVEQAVAQSGGDIAAAVQGLDFLPESIRAALAAGLQTAGDQLPEKINALLEPTESETDADLTDLKTKYEAVLDQLPTMDELYRKRLVLRKARGGMDIESNEAKLVMDENGRCIDIVKRDRGTSECMIEEFMLLANQCAANAGRTNKAPFVYRVHEAPDAEKMEKLSATLLACGLNAKFKNPIPTQLELAALLDETRGQPIQIPVHTGILRSMQKARYAPQPLGHYGLVLKDYAHFTSPIRRYPDLAIHRIMTDLLKGTEKETMILRYTDFAERASKQSSEREVIAMQIERKAEDCYKAEYARRHLGECYEGTISGVTQRGLFIELDNGVEGFVPASSLTPSGTSLTEGVRLTDPASGKTWSLGDKMMITIVRADVNLGKIDFEVAPAAKA